MQRKEMVLKACLQRATLEEQKALLRFLPEEERQILEGLPVRETEPESWEMDGALQRVHWSWFLEPIKAYPARDQKLFLSVLDPHSNEQLRATLGVKTAKESLTKLGKAFLQKELLDSLQEEHPILPPSFLPRSPLNILTTLGKKDLIRLINLLSLYDLCAELRHIVETKTLKKIYKLLGSDERTALKTISSEMPDGHLSARMGLDRNWDGTKESLHVLLHRKGLNRLGIALSGQDPDLIWIICHHLDIGRGRALLKLTGKESVTGLSDIAIQQVIDSVHLLTRTT